jgi:hypothetical protein
LITVISYNILFQIGLFFLPRRACTNLLGSLGSCDPNDPSSYIHNLILKLPGDLRSAILCFISSLETASTTAFVTVPKVSRSNRYFCNKFLMYFRRRIVALLFMPAGVYQFSLSTTLSLQSTMFFHRRNIEDRLLGIWVVWAVDFLIELQ